MISIKSSNILLWIIGFIILAFAIYRDVHIEQQYSSDLRNRVVGSRIQKDGSYPYFYKWQKNDGFRYYDPANFDSLKVANITASPFFHQLLYPIADLPQRIISKIWLMGEYLIFFIAIVIAFSFTGDRRQRMMIICIAALFLLSEGWIAHIANGQNYLHSSFLFLLFCFFLRRKENLWWAATAGLCAISMVLIRVNTAIFFLPFLPLVSRYNKKYMIAFITPIVLLCGWTLINHQERLLWIDYRNGIGEQVKIHQKLQPTIQYNEPDPKFPVWEGINSKQIEEQSLRFPIVIHSENGNVFVLAEKLLHIKIKPTSLIIISLLIIFILFAFFQYKNRGIENFDLLNRAVFGFCLYMISDLFSPIWRHQYYTAQWLCPLLLAAATFQPSQKWIFVFAGIGLVLNILNIDTISMEHTAGEYILLLSMLYLTLIAKPVKAL